MSIHDDKLYPWLSEEKEFISLVIEKGKKVLGICLGAQLIADVLNASVHKNHCKEIGWFPLARSKDIEQHSLASVLPDSFMAFHWHGDTFDLPEQALSLASSEACKHQGFIWHDHVIALQFHLETTAENASKLIAHCSNELITSPTNGSFIQTQQQMLADKNMFSDCNALMKRLLDYLITL